MGRTTPTTAVIMHKERSALSAYRRALPKAYRREFDEMWAYISHYLMPCTCADYPLSFYIFMLSILLEQRKRMTNLRLE
jgi:hypothetical protein